MNINDLPEILTVEEIGHYLRLGRSSAYQLVANPSFPAIRINRQIRVTKEAFVRWMGEQKGVGLK